MPVDVPAVPTAFLHMTAGCQLEAAHQSIAAKSLHLKDRHRGLAA